MDVSDLLISIFVDFKQSIFTSFPVDSVSLITHSSVSPPFLISHDTLLISYETSTSSSTRLNPSFRPYSDFSFIRGSEDFWGLTVNLLKLKVEFFEQ